MPRHFLRTAIFLVIFHLSASPIFADEFDDAVVAIEQYGRVQHSDGYVRRITITEQLTDAQFTALGDSFEAIGPVRNFILYAGQNITDLSPLRGLQTNELALTNIYNVTDLSPLNGMQLSELVLHLERENQTTYHEKLGPTDLTPLANIAMSRLRLINLDDITDLSALADLSLTSLVLREMDNIQDISPLAGMPLESLIIAASPNISDISSIKGAPLGLLHLDTTKISDLSPIINLPLETLSIANSPLITSFPTIASTQISHFHLSGSPEISDLTPLGTQVNLIDLSLDSMPKITELNIFENAPLSRVALTNMVGLENIDGLAGAQIHDFSLVNAALISDITALSGHPLERVSLRGSSAITDISPLIGAPLDQLNLLDANGLSDLSLLAGQGIAVQTNNQKLRQSMGPD